MQTALSLSQLALGTTHTVASTWLHVRVRLQSGRELVEEEKRVAGHRTDCTTMSMSEQVRDFSMVDPC